MFTEICERLYEERAAEREQFIENALGFIRDIDNRDEFIPVVGKLIQQTILEVPFEKWVLVDNGGAFYAVDDTILELHNDGWAKVIRRDGEYFKTLGRYRFEDEILNFLEELRIFEIILREQRYEDELISGVYKLIGR